jgi:hypothetical protein
MRTTFPSLRLYSGSLSKKATARAVPRMDEGEAGQGEAGDEED